MDEMCRKPTCREFRETMFYTMTLFDALFQSAREADAIFSSVLSSDTSVGSKILRWSKEMKNLASRECVPCRGGMPPMRGEEIAEFSAELDGWEVVQEHHLLKTYKHKDFGAALKFVNRVGQLAEEQGHHPDISFGWGYAEIKIWTHKIDGLSESDFILAAKIDKIQ
jgi:4a-hydroxytetrahydrobiopterin dehydratase